MHNVHQDLEEIRAIARKRNLRVWDVMMQRDKLTLTDNEALENWYQQQEAEGKVFKAGTFYTPGLKKKPYGARNIGVASLVAGWKQPKPIDYDKLYHTQFEFINHGR